MNEERFTLDFMENDCSFNLEFDENIHVADGEEYYDGDYKVTPQQEEVVLAICGKKMSGNVIVSPIPKEYGRVTYNNNKVLRIT